LAIDIDIHVVGPRSADERRAILDAGRGEYVAQCDAGPSRIADRAHVPGIARSLFHVLKMCPTIAGALHGRGHCPGRKCRLKFGDRVGARAVDQAVQRYTMIVGQLRRRSVTADVEIRLRRQEGRDQFIRRRFRIERLRTAED
jgi:hypothetical protein